MGVQHPPGEAVVEGPTENGPEPGHGHQCHPPLEQPIGQHGGVAVPIEIVTKRRTVDHNRLHVVAGGPRYRRAGSIRDHQVDRQAGLNHCVQNRAGS